MGWHRWEDCTSENHGGCGDCWDGPVEEDSGNVAYKFQYIPRTNESSESESDMYVNDYGHPEDAPKCEMTYAASGLKCKNDAQALCRLDGIDKLACSGHASLVQQLLRATRDDYVSFRSNDVRAKFARPSRNSVRWFRKSA